MTKQEQATVEMVDDITLAEIFEGNVKELTEVFTDRQRFEFAPDIVKGVLVEERENGFHVDVVTKEDKMHRMVLTLNKIEIEGNEVWLTEGDRPTLVDFLGSDWNMDISIVRQPKFLRELVDYVYVRTLDVRTYSDQLKEME